VKSKSEYCQWERKGGKTSPPTGRIQRGLKPYVKKMGQFGKKPRNRIPEGGGSRQEEESTKVTSRGRGIIRRKDPWGERRGIFGVWEKRRGKQQRLKGVQYPLETSSGKKRGLTLHQTPEKKALGN